MLGIGMQEILIILVVALIVIGPKRLPDLAKTLGRGFAEFKKAADDLEQTVRKDLEFERRKEFAEKYPDLIPDEEGKPDAAGPGGEPPVEESSGMTAGPVAAEQPSPLSYSPDEIEGGDYEDEGKDV
ncbi:MAG: twin-arginine translocase subunit TatB [bacterium]|nr:MAG: twin-arginine translocase subunit TatB [bacterium]